MPIYIYRLNTKTRSTMLCLSGFELYSRWVPLYKVVHNLLATKASRFTASKICDLMSEQHTRSL